MNCYCDSFSLSLALSSDCSVTILVISIWMICEYIAWSFWLDGVEARVVGSKAAKGLGGWLSWILCLTCFSKAKLVCSGSPFSLYSNLMSFKGYLSGMFLLFYTVYLTTLEVGFPNFCLKNELALPSSAVVCGSEETSVFIGQEAKPVAGLIACYFTWFFFSNLEALIKKPSPVLRTSLKRSFDSPDSSSLLSIEL